MHRGKSVVGDLINFRGLVYARMNENGVVSPFQAKHVPIGDCHVLLPTVLTLTN